MTSEVDICNLAMADIGSTAVISSLGESSVEAKYCNIFYEAARDALLEEYEWPFAHRKVELASTGTPPQQWLFQYAYPNNTIACRRIWQLDRQAAPLPFELIASDDLQSRLIVTDTATASMMVTSKVTLPTLFPPKFIEALHFKLASMLAMPITKKRTMRSDMLEAYARALTSAATSSLNQQVGALPRDPDWITGRG
tara:strand:- start:17733 stop:18323 length:591 start_codon:yes stop_codon:yes gene_type:complete